MRIKLLVATVDSVYAKLLADNISEHHSDIMDVCVCNNTEHLNEVLSKQKYDVALLDETLIKDINTSQINLPLLLWPEEETIAEIPEEARTIRKYQRISSIIATVLELYAGITKNRHIPDSSSAYITAVWSPAGGVGKTTVALAYAMQNVSEGKAVFYLNLEDFSSLPGLLNDNGKSISSVFEMLDDNNGNVKMLIQGISCKDKGITYLCKPDNYDDMCVLSSDNISELITVCAELADELVIDLSCSCDKRVIKVFGLADKILIVTEDSGSAKSKLEQFILQNDVFENIKDKSVLIANKGAVINHSPINNAISLPFVQISDPLAICGTLSETRFYRD